MLRIRLFGELELRLDAAALEPFESARAASLLACLLLHRDAPQQRQYLAFRLWPDSTEAQARTNLRHVLHHLRHALPGSERFLDVRTRTLQWKPHAPYWLDVAEFDQALSRAEHSEGADAIAALREGLALYRGELLEGSYDEWLLPERERLHRRYLASVERLAALLETRGEHADAIACAERLLRHDPLREESYRLLMRLHAARGDRARAVHVYHACTATIERELGVQPSAATREVYEALLPAEREAEPDASGAGRGAAPAAARAAVAAAGRAAGWPLIGRTAEWTRLTSLWRAAESGHAHLVLLTGEPGVGKTRLVEELRSWCAQRGAATAEARSYAAEGGLAYAPLVAWLRSESFQPRVARLDRPHLSELARLLPELLVERPELPRPELLPESDQRHRLFDAAARAIFAAEGPILLVAEDVQWCDRETLQFLHYLLRARSEARLLVVATARREEMDPHDAVDDLVAGLRALDRCTELRVERLTRGETATLAERVAGSRMSEADAARLHDDTGGNPLFVVELVRAGWRGTDANEGWMSPKVQAVIQARLAQLSPPARDLVGVAATIGREFTAQVLADASGADEITFVRALDELWRRGIMLERGADGYDFTHDRIREAAYHALGPAVRRHHHLHVAEALERLHAGDSGPVSAQLAAHYERAGSADVAVSWYERAAHVAQQLHANAEGVRLLERALSLLDTLPDTAQRRARELAILTALPAFVGAVEGFASARLMTAQQRALDLATALGVEPDAPLVRSLAVVSLSRGDFAMAQWFGAQLTDRGEREADDVLVVEAAYVLGIAAFWQGELAAARRHFEKAVERFRPASAATHLVRYGLDPEVVCRARLANTLWFLGFPEQATSARDAALARAREIGHPHTLAVALVFATVLALDMRDDERFREYAAAVMRESAEPAGPHVRSAADAFAGYVDVLDGRTAAGLARIERALESVAGAEPAPGTHAMLARVLLAACSAAGDARAGLGAADRALATSGAVRLWEAETRRLRAEFLATLRGQESEVEEELARALEVARRQGARSFEQRVAASIARLVGPAVAAPLVAGPDPEVANRALGEITSKA